MRVNFCVTRHDPRTKRGRNTLKNDSVEVENGASHERIIAAIKDKYPLWIIVGYAKIPEKKRVKNATDL